MDTGPQKESDTTGSREEGEREKRAFQGYTEEPAKALQQPYRQQGTNICVFYVKSCRKRLYKTSAATKRKALKEQV